MTVECPECGDWEDIVVYKEARDIIDVNKQGRITDFLGTDPFPSKPEFQCRKCGLMLERCRDEYGDPYFKEDTSKKQEPVECPECGKNGVLRKKEVVEVRPVVDWTYDDGKIVNVKTGKLFDHKPKNPGLVDEIVYQCMHCKEVL